MRCDPPALLPHTTSEISCFSDCPVCERPADTHGRAGARQAVRDFVGATRSDVGNMPSLRGIFPDYSAPIVRDVMARLGYAPGGHCQTKCHTASCRSAAA